MAYYVISLLGKDPKVQSQNYERLYFKSNRYFPCTFTSSIDKATLFNSTQDIYRYLFTNYNGVNEYFNEALNGLEYQEDSIDIRKVTLSAKKVMESIDLNENYKEKYNEWKEKRHEILSVQERENKRSQTYDYSS